ncbi:MAG: nuclear transport factor 2 family protein [Pseudomonadales bacterium]|jgi:ketosteroid isomerase-like protein|nr:nuclear transport factor 2 family protein [Pseudomonadales bacterium]MCP5336376.1 nuclear transport factor 2 family protein [Pseudomonadales bacterium]
MNDAIEARLATLETQLTELQDREAIRNLIASYGPLADCGDADRVAGLWQDDGVYEVGGFGASQGHAAIAALIDGATHRQLMRDGCAHLLGPVHIHIEGGRAVAVGHSCVLRHRDGGFEAYRVSANRWELTKDADGTWRVSKRSNRLLDGNPLAPALLRP